MSRYIHDIANLINSSHNTGITPIRCGDLCQFGRYRYNVKRATPKPILWRVHSLFRNNDNNKTYISLVSVYGVDAVPYALEDTSTWKSSYLRKWLNDDFYHTAFNDDEKLLISAHRNNGDHIVQPDDFFECEFLHGKEKFCEATPYADRKMADEPSLHRAPGAVYYDANGKEIVSRASNRNVTWTVPLRINLNSDAHTQKMVDPSLDSDGEIIVCISYKLREMQEDGKIFINKWITKKTRNIKLKALARPILTICTDEIPVIMPEPTPEHLARLIYFSNFIDIKRSRS